MGLPKLEYDVYDYFSLAVIPVSALQVYMSNSKNIFSENLDLPAPTVAGEHGRGEVIRDHTALPLTDRMVAELNDV